MTNPAKADLTRPPFPAIAAGSSCVYSCSLTDTSTPPLAVPISEISALTLSLVVTGTDQIINGVDAVNILNTGRGAVTTDAEGDTVVTVTLGPADTPFLSPEGTLEEQHSIVLTFVYGTPALTGRHEAFFRVVPVSGG